MSQFVPGLYPQQEMVLEVRECATLGNYFADVYLNGKLFARELSRPVAETFVQHPTMYTNAFADEAKMRTWILEQGDAEAMNRIEKGKI